MQRRGSSVTTLCIASLQLQHSLRAALSQRQRTVAVALTRSALGLAAVGYLLLPPYFIVKIGIISSDMNDTLDALHVLTLTDAHTLDAMVVVGSIAGALAPCGGALYC